MKKVFYVIIMIGFLGGCAQQGEQPSHKVTTLVKENGGRVDWGEQGIAHSRYGEDGFYDLWIMNDDGSGAYCITCDTAIPQLHNGQPAWHPSSRYLVFQSQDPSLPHKPLEDLMFTQPGHGKHNNLWITDLKGNFYQLTNIKENNSVLHPHFSHNGSQLLWSEKIGNDPLDWAIMIADFVKTPQPHLENIVPYQPLGNVWYETHDFSPDDSHILLTVGTREEYSGFDIWEMDIKTQKMKQLTDNPDQWDEHAHYSPDGKKIVWASSCGYPYDPKKWQKSLKTELWIMDVDGSNKERLTYFNEPGHHEYIGPAIAADNSWSPDGKKLVVSVSRGSREDTRIIMVEFEPEYDKNQRHGNNSYIVKKYHPYWKSSWLPWEYELFVLFGCSLRSPSYFLLLCITFQLTQYEKFFQKNRNLYKFRMRQRMR